MKSLEGSIADLSKPAPAEKTQEPVEPKEDAKGGGKGKRAKVTNY